MHWFFPSGISKELFSVFVETAFLIAFFMICDHGDKQHGLKFSNRKTWNKAVWLFALVLAGWFLRNAAMWLLFMVVRASAVWTFAVIFVSLAVWLAELVLAEKLLFKNGYGKAAGRKPGFEKAGVVILLVCVAVAIPYELLSADMMRQFDAMRNSDSILGMFALLSGPPDSVRFVMGLFSEFLSTGALYLLLLLLFSSTFDKRTPASLEGQALPEIEPNNKGESQ